MATIYAFNGQLEIHTAFTWDKPSGKIQQFFKNLGANPAKYGVPTRPIDYTYDAELAAKAFDTLSKLDVPSFAPGQRVKLHYGSMKSEPFEMNSIFDVLGWIFSIASTPPPKVDKSSFYYPLTALYCKFCLVFTTLKVDRNEMPTMISALWFNSLHEGPQALLGANLDNPDRQAKPKKKKNDFQEARRQRFVREGWIGKDEQSSSQTFDHYPRPVAQKYGHCAETDPFLFLKRAFDEGMVEDEPSIRGFAISPSKYMKETIPARYEEASLKQALTAPCLNCAHIILRLGLSLDQFYPLWS